MQLAPLDEALGDNQPLTVEVAIASVRQVRKLKLVVPPAPTDHPSRKDPALIKLVVQALTLRERMADSAAETFEELAAGVGYSREHAADLLRVSYLAPDILTAILAGQQPESLSRAKLIKAPRLPLEWNEQGRVLGFS